MDTETTALLEGVETRRAPDVMTRRAALEPRTFNAEARTVDLIWTTGADVRRRDFWTGETWIERLTVSDKAVDMARLNAGAPLLNTHGQWDLGDVIGVVERAWIEGGKGHATVRFSDRPEVAPILADVRAGILRNISVGYAVEAWRETEPTANAPRIREAVRWTPMEISLVPVPADAGAQVRAAPAHIPDPSGADDPPHPATRGTAPHTTEARMPETNDPAGADAPIEEARAVPQHAPAPTTQPAPLAVLRAIATRAGLDAAWTLAQFEAGATEVAARDAAIDAVAARSAAPAIQPAISVTRDEGDTLRAALSDALAVRAMPSFRPSTDAWKAYRNLRPSEMLIELAQSRGERVTARDRMDVIERSFHSTSDFPLLLASASNKMLEAGYTAANPTYRQFMARRRFNDFKAHSFLTVGDFPSLTELTEGGAITAGTVSEKREQISLKTYARQVRVTRQMLVNDDLGAFADFGAMIGRRVADFENATAFVMVNTASGDGPTLTTGNAAVFGTGATRANKASSGGAIAEATLDTAHAAMMAQTSIDGVRLNLTPSILLTGTAYRGAALRYTTRISPESGANVGLYSNLTPIADANLTGNRWYLFADPAAAPVYVYGFLGDSEAPMVRTDTPMGVDAVVVEVKHDFAVGAIDHRGGYFNPGA